MPTYVRLTITAGALVFVFLLTSCNHIMQPSGPNPVYSLEKVSTTADSVLVQLVPFADDTRVEYQVREVEPEAVLNFNSGLVRGDETVWIPIRQGFAVTFLLTVYYERNVTNEKEVDVAN